MKKIAVFPGSFDPFTLGHKNLMQRALPIFDKIIIMVGYNSSKNSFFDLDTRMSWIKRIFKDDPKVEITKYDGITVNFCKKSGAKYILRGIRNATDLEYEKTIAQTNKMLDSEIDTIFLLTPPEYTNISSLIVRDILIHGGDASCFMPKEISSQELKAARN